MSKKITSNRLVIEGSRKLPCYPEIISRVDRVQCREIENCCVATLKIGDDPCLKNRDVARIIRRCLKDYANAFTTVIIGKAGGECGIMTYDLESHYEARDLLDPEFPNNGRDIFPEDDDYRPEHVLSLVCHSRIEVIVKILTDMESAWMNMKSISESNIDVCSLLWNYAKEEAASFVKDKFGAEKAEEFLNMGCTLFNDS